MKRNSKRFLSLLLALAMLFTLVGTPVYADDDNVAATEVSEETVSDSEGATSDSAVTASTSDSSASSAAEELQAQIDALPSVDELSAMTTEELNEVYEQFLSCCEAYDALSEDEQAQVNDSALDALADYFNGTAVSADEEGGSSTGLPAAVDGVVTLTDDIALESLTIDSDTTIDLGSYTLTLTDGITLNANLTVKGSGVITNADTSNDLITVNADSVTVTIEGGTLKSGCDGIYSNGHTGVSVVMNGGTITTADGQNGNDAIHFYAGSENSVTINDGVIEADKIAVEFNYSTSACYVNVNGGSFKQGNTSYGIIVGAITVIKDGYEWTKSDGYYTVAEYSGDTVATVNGTNYATLRAAFAAAKDGDTITLAKDYTVDEVVGLGYQCGAEVAYKDVTFDLNGHTITVDSTAGGNNFALIYVHKDSKLTLTDSSSDGSGKIDIQTSSTYAVRNCGNFVMDGGTISSVGYGIESKPYYYYCYSDASTAEYVSTTTTINGGTITGTSSSADVLRVDNATDYTAELTINDVDFTGGMYLSGTYISGVTAVINGGSFTSGNISDSLIEINYGTTLEINGGTFEAAEGTYSSTSLITIRSDGGSIEVNDGTFTTSANNLISVSNSSSSKSYSVTLNDGTFTSEKNIVYVSYSTKDNCTVDLTGGTYDPEPDTSYCAEGTTVIANGDGTYSIISADESAVAVISDSEGKYTSYPTLKAASAALSDGCTVTLVADSYNSPFTLSDDYNVTLELNGYSINMSADAAYPRTPVTVEAGTLTIKDSSSAGTGKIAAGENSSQGAVYNTGGTVNIESGTYNILKTYTGAIVTSGESAVTNINGGNFYGVTYAVHTTQGTVNINGGYLYAATNDVITVEAESETESATAAVSDGKTTGSALFMSKANATTANITGGYFKCGIVYTDSSSDTTGNAIIAFSSSGSNNPDIEISGGTFSGNRYGTVSSYLAGSCALSFISDTTSSLYEAGYRFEIGYKNYLVGSYDSDGNFVANSGYTTAKEAIANATSDYPVVYVYASSSADDPITTAISASNSNNVEVILDLNGCYISTTGSAITVAKGTKLKIVDSAGGAIVSSSVGQAGTIRNAGGVVTIEDGTFVQTGATDDNDYVFVVYTAKAYGADPLTDDENAATYNYINGGTFICSGGYAFGGNVGTTTMTGGYVDTTKVSAVSATLNITGGYFSADPASCLTTDYAAYDNSDNTYVYVVLEAGQVAKIGSTYYATLEEAFTAAEDGDTITVLTDVELDSQVIVSSTVTLDLNGCSVTRSDENKTAALFLVTDGTFTVQDTSTGASGSIDGATYTLNGSTYVGYGIYITGGTVNINSGTVAGYRAVYGNAGTLNVNGGTVSATQIGIFADGTLNVNIYDGAEVTNTSGTITKWAFYTNTTYTGTTNIYGGTIGGENSKYAVSVWGGTVNVIDGTLTAVNTAVTAYYSDTTVTIGTADGTGPTLTGNTYYGIEMGSGAEVTVNSGTITGVSCGVFVGYGTDEDNYTTLNVTGGSITATADDSIGICTNGSQSYTEINISGGSVSGSYGMYLPAMSSKTTISGDAVITGTVTGIEIRAGELYVLGGTISSTCNTFETTVNGSGTTVIGAGIAISQHSTNKEVTVVITGGEISGQYGVFEINTYANNTSDVTLTISEDEGNTTKITGTKEAIYSTSISGAVEGVGTSYTSADTTFAVSGGSFSSVVDYEYCAEGFVPVTTKDADGMYTVTAGTAVVAVTDSNGTVIAYYSTVTEAAKSDYASSESGEYIIVLLDDIEEDVVIPLAANVTLDLACHSITSVSSHAIANYGTLTIIDTDATEESYGKVQATVTGKAALYNQGSVTVKGGYFTRTSGTWYTVVNDGYDSEGNALETTATMIFEDGVTVETSPSVDNNSSMIHNYGGTMYVNGGTFTSDCLACIKNEPNSILYVNGGIITNLGVEASTKQGAIINCGTITVTDGTICSNNYYAIFATSSSYKGTATITGGTFVNTGSNTSQLLLLYQVADTASTKDIVTGGTFTNYKINNTTSKYDTGDNLYLLYDSKNTVTVSDTEPTSGTYQAMRADGHNPVYFTDADDAITSAYAVTDTGGTIYLWAELDSTSNKTVSTTGYTFVYVNSEVTVDPSLFTPYTQGMAILTDSGTTQYNNSEYNYYHIYQGVTKESAQASVIVYGTDEDGNTITASTEYYATLTAAVLAANQLTLSEGQTITVQALKSHTYSGTMQPKISMTIDLNGCTFTADNSFGALYMTTDGITVTVIDSSDDQTGALCKKYDTLKICTVTKGNLVFESGHYFGILTGVSSTDMLTITGGYYTADPTDYLATGYSKEGGEYTLDGNTYSYKVVEGFNLGQSNSDEETVPATIASGADTATMYALVTGDNISSYYETDNYPTTSLTYTDDDGNIHSYVFAGWYSTTEDSGAMEEFPSGDAYAKFVDADVLTAKCIVTTVGEATRWRFMTSLDTLYFIGVGFEVKDSDGNDVSLSKTTISKTSLNVTSIDPNIRTYATDFSSASTRVVTAYFDDSTNATSATYTVTPYWTTGDGTKVTGATASFTYKGTNGSITADSAE